MARSSRYILIAIILIALIAVSAFFVGRWFISQRQDETPPEEQVTATGDTPQTIENPEVQENTYTTDATAEDGTQSTNPPVDNSDLAESLEPPEKMQEVINKNKDNLNNAEVIRELAPSYPADLIPIYKATNAADSSDIITVNGKPGWTANYGSDATVEDISAFYNELLSGEDAYATQQNGETTEMSAVVDNCTVQINISPNNREQTGLDDNSNVSIFIERN